MSERTVDDDKYVIRMFDRAGLIATLRSEFNPGPEIKITKSYQVNRGTRTFHRIDKSGNIMEYKTTFY